MDNYKENKMLRKCRKCGLEAHEVKNLENFVRDKTSPHGCKNLCRECKREAYVNDPDREYDKNLRKNYGITLEDYNAMLAEQDGCCAICGRHQLEFKHRLHVDHDHKTGAVRQLLCVHCNRLLGSADDDISILLEAINYINKHKR